tara:strand:+ start:76 stop:309 length:234 start_codon:yes stop_codon:yes gene_type:complete
MNLDKDTYTYVNKMINNKESLTSIKSFCKGFGIDVLNYSSPIYICNESSKITIRYRRKNYYTYFINPKNNETIYFIR